MKDNIKILLYVSLVVLGFMLWQEWQQQYPALPQASEESRGKTNIDPDIPQANLVKPSGAAERAQGFESSNMATESLIAIQTDVLDIKLDLKGGNLVGLDLSQYPLSLSLIHI